MCRLSWNLGASTSWNPQGLSRPVMGLLMCVCVCGVVFFLKILFKSYFNLSVLMFCRQSLKCLAPFHCLNGILLVKVTHAVCNIQVTKLNNWYLNRTESYLAPELQHIFLLSTKTSKFAYPIEWVLYGSFLHEKRSHDLRLVTHLHLMPGSRIRRFVPQPHLYTFMASTATTILLHFILRCGGVGIIW